MTTIAENTGLVTLINVFTVEPSNQWNCLTYSHALPTHPFVTCRDSSVLTEIRPDGQCPIKLTHLDARTEIDPLLRLSAAPPTAGMPRERSFRRGP